MKSKFGFWVIPLLLLLAPVPAAWAAGEPTNPDWITAEPGRVYSHFLNCIQHGGLFYVFNHAWDANSTSVWSSPDGVRWKCLTRSTEFGPRDRFGVVSFKGKLYVLGGYDLTKPSPISYGITTYLPENFRQDVWSSTDGTHWVLETNNPGFSPRRSMALGVHDGRIWMAGGNFNKSLGDVWSSADGVHWDLATAAAPFPPGERGELLSFAKKIWYLNPCDAGWRFTGQVWSSSDGVTWVLENKDFGLAGEDRAAFVRDGKLYVFDGREVLHTSTDGRTWAVEGTVQNTSDGTKILERDGNLWSLGMEGVFASTDKGWKPLLQPPQTDPVMVYPPAFAVFQGQLLMLGTPYEAGYPPNFSSILSYNPTQETPWSYLERRLPFGERIGGVVTPFQGKLWILGGRGRGGASDNSIWSSSDGTHWNQEVPEAPFGGRWNHRCAQLNGYLYLIGGEDESGPLGDVWRSKDGLHWEKRTAKGPFGRRSGMVLEQFHGALMLAGGWNGTDADLQKGDVSEKKWYSDIWTSVDGERWVKGKNQPSFSPRAFCASTVNDEKLWVMGGEVAGSDGAGVSLTNEVWTLSGGWNWQKEEWGSCLPRRTHSQAGVFQGRLFVAGGGCQPFFPDLAGENDRVASGSRVLHSIHRSGRKVPASPGIPQQNVIPLDGRPDGAVTIVEWFDREMEHLYRRGRFMTGASPALPGPDPYFSPSLPEAPTEQASSSLGGGEEPGKNWTQVPVSEVWGESPGSFVVFNDRLWVVGGMIPGLALTNTVWSSRDGTHWEEVLHDPPFPPREKHSAAAHDGKLWVIGGDDMDPFDDVWSSPDGVQWTQVSAHAGFSPRTDMTCLSFGGKIWVIGGNGKTNDFLNDIWSSADGASWEKARTGLIFSPRHGHASTVFDGKMWVAGGLNAPNVQPANFNDVWSSGDGQNWVRMTPGAQFGPRSGLGLAALGNRLYLIGSSEGRTLDMWTSEDGVDWKLVNDKLPFYGTWDGVMVQSWKDKIWVIGKDSIWYSPPEGEILK